MPHGPRTPGQPLTNDDEGHGNGIGQQVTADGLLVLAVALAEEADQWVQLVLTQALRAQDMRSACSQDPSFLPLPCSRLDPALLAPSGPGFCYRSDLPPSHLPKKTVKWENERVGGIRVKPGGGMAGRVPGYTRESLGMKCKHPQEGAAPCRIRSPAPFLQSGCPVASRPLWHHLGTPAPGPPGCSPAPLPQPHLEDFGSRDEAGQGRGEGGPEDAGCDQGCEAGHHAHSLQGHRFRAGVVGGRAQNPHLGHPRRLFSQGLGPDSSI